MQPSVSKFILDTSFSRTLKKAEVGGSQTLKKNILQLFSDWTRMRLLNLMEFPPVACLMCLLETRGVELICSSPKAMLYHTCL